MSHLPAYVIHDGTWDDLLWRSAAAVPADSRSPEQQVTIVNGPRQHPYGIEAFQAQLPDGRVAIFPSKEAYTAHMGQSQAQSALDQINTGLAKGAALSPPQG